MLNKEQAEKLLKTNYGIHNPSPLEIEQLRKAFDYYKITSQDQKSIRDRLGYKGKKLNF